MASEDITSSDEQDFDVSPSNPLNWSKCRKWSIVMVMSTMNLITNMAVVLCIPAVPQILRDIHTSNSLYGTILVSVWEVGEALGPILTGPLSELFGRSPVYNISNVIFVVFSLACALSTNPSMLIAFRFFNGIGDAALTLNASVVGDMFIQEERGLPIAIMGFPPLVGPIAGPVAGGFLTQAAGWQWAFWLSVITGGSCTLAFALLYRETYRPRLVQQHRKKIEKDLVGAEIPSNNDLNLKKDSTFLLRALVRPLKLLFRSRVVLILATYLSVVYGFSYILLVTIVEVFEGTYGFSQGAAGLAYLGLSIGMVISVLACAFTLDRFMKYQLARTGKMEPEHRLPVMLLGGILTPIGLFIYGWTAEYRVFYIVPLIGTAIVGFGFFATTIPMQAYLVDAFGEYAASAVAATVISRCIVAAVLPLAGPPLYDQVGLGWGNSILGFIAVAFIPVPILFMRFGKRMRDKTDMRHLVSA